MKKASQRTELRITGQERTMHMRIYDLACEGSRLRLEVAPVDVDGAEAWRVEAKVRPRADANAEVTSANETAATRTEALRALARTWRSNEAQHGIRMFDWEAVEVLLGSVRAL
jgi:hypothetical protein